LSFLGRGVVRRQIAEVFKDEAYAFLSVGSVVVNPPCQVVLLAKKLIFRGDSQISPARCKSSAHCAAARVSVVWAPTSFQIATLVLLPDTGLLLRSGQIR
jgi:hypothetical protein